MSEALVQLLEQRKSLKAAEERAADLRKAKDAEVMALAKTLLTTKSEGSVSHKVPGFKLTLTGTVDRKADTEAIKAAFAELPPSVQGVFRFTADVNTKALRALGEEDAVKAAAFYSSSESKLTMKIEEAE